MQLRERLRNRRIEDFDVAKEVGSTTLIFVERSVLRRFPIVS